MHHLFASTRRKWSSKKRHDMICIKLLLLYDMYKLIASLLIGIDIGTGHRLVQVELAFKSWLTESAALRVVLI